MILLDTSVIIGYLKGFNERPHDLMDDFIAQGVALGICNQVYQEVLQGAKSKNEFDVLKEYLNTMDFYDVRYGKKSYESAAMMYFKCRKAGIKPRSTVDMIIAQIAIENNLLLLHNDRDFVQIAQVIGDLKIL